MSCVSRSCGEELTRAAGERERERKKKSGGQPT